MKKKLLRKESPYGLARLDTAMKRLHERLTRDVHLSAFLYYFTHFFGQLWAQVHSQNVRAANGILLLNFRLPRQTSAPDTTKCRIPPPGS